MSRTIGLGPVEIELKIRGRLFLGVGRVGVGGTVVRSGRLPIRPFTQTLDGLDYDRYEIENIRVTSTRLIIRTRAVATAGAVAVQQDHSLDPVWSTRPWDGRPVAADRMDWVIERATRVIGGRRFEGFAYHYRFHSTQRSVWYLLDRATWELGGRAEGLTLLRQQMAEDPRVTLRKGTRYCTSACIPFPLNPVMTHDVPRWSSEQGFDYQYRGSTALVGMFAQAALIRAIVARDPDEPQVRHLDKHIFDAARSVATTPKFIGVATGVGDDTDHINAWTCVFDADQDNVLGEFGMRRPLVQTSLNHNFWHSFTADSYRKDLLPAARALAVQKVFIDPIWENDMTRVREGRLISAGAGNMCCPHEYEVAKVLGGIGAYRRLARDFAAAGVELQSWIGSHQSIHSPLLAGAHRNHTIRLADGRHWWKSGYDVIIGMDLASPFGAMFRDALIRAFRATGIRRFLYDSFYNFGFMPVSYYTPDPGDPGNPHKGTLRPHTQWRALLEIMAAWQKAGIEMVIESLGPWGQGQHGVQGHYERRGSEPLAYQCSVCGGYSVIPAPGVSAAAASESSRIYYRFLANKAPPALSLFALGRQRVDHAGNAAALRRANLDYRAALPFLCNRTVLPDNAGVLWADRKGRTRILFAFRRGIRPLERRTRATNLTTGKTDAVDPRKGMFIEPLNTYLLSERE